MAEIWQKSLALHMTV